DHYGRISFKNLQWSLNNKKLLIETFNESLVLDINKQKIFNLCFDDKNLKRDDWTYDSFFYPSDGQYIVMHLHQEGANYHYQSFDALVDLKNMHAYKLST